MLSSSRCALVVGAAVGLGGCYVVPVAPDGTPVYSAPAVPGVVAPAPVYVVPPYAPGPQAAATLRARLYPSNDVAAEGGMLTGTVTNLMTGKGVFQLEYRGELLSGEATRVRGDERSGVANAYGSRGTFMNCNYRMTTAYQGTGTCTLSTGALYHVHIGG